MPPSKVQAFVLKVIPFRESSSILYLYSRDFGLIHVIAKGIKRKKSKQNFIERGFLIELLCYIKPGKNLYTGSKISVMNFFPVTRSNLMKNSLRDLMFEIVLKGCREMESNKELFGYMHRFLLNLEKVIDDDYYFCYICKIFIDLSSFFGFALDLNHCIYCGKALTEKGGYIDIERGGIACVNCSAEKPAGLSISKTVIYNLKNKYPNPEKNSFPQKDEAVKAARLFSLFIRYHLNISNEFKTLEFIYDLHRNV